MGQAQNKNGIEELIDSLELPELVERAVRWVERHPRTVVTGALVVTALGVLLAQSLPNPLKSETPSDETETPLFI